VLRPDHSGEPSYSRPKSKTIMVPDSAPCFAAHYYVSGCIPPYHYRRADSVRCVVDSGFNWRRRSGLVLTCVTSLLMFHLLRRQWHSWTIISPPTASYQLQPYPIQLISSSDPPVPDTLSLSFLTTHQPRSWFLYLFLVCSIIDPSNLESHCSFYTITLLTILPILPILLTQFIYNTLTYALSLQKSSRVMVMGESHVRRMSQIPNLAELSHLEDIDIQFLGVGGTGLAC